MRLTGRGVAVLVTAAVLLLVGLLLGLPLLRAVAGFAAGALLVAMVPALGRLRPVIRREIHPDRVQRGSPAVAQLVVTNASGQRQPAFVARDTAGDHAEVVDVRALPPGGSARYLYELPTQRRGRIDVGPLVVERSDLLGLARSRGEVGEVTQLWVYPRRHAVRLSPAGRSRHHHEGEPPRLPMPGSMDLRALREYVVGDEPRHLHWKATARTGQLMVREYVDPAQPWSLIMLDDRAAALSPAAFEEAVEIVASLLWESCELDRPGRFCTASGQRIETRGGATGARDLLDRLCLVQQTDHPELALDVARIGGRRGDGWFVHVGGTPDPAVSLAARRFGQAVMFDLGTGEPAPTVTPTIRAADAGTAIATWNRMVSR